MAKTPAWQRKEGQNPKGGLNAKGRASYKRQTGGTLKAPVKSGDNPRRASFLARMGNMRGPERDAKGKPTRLLLSLRAWGASSKADARAKARAITKRNKAKRNEHEFVQIKSAKEKAMPYHSMKKPAAKKKTSGGLTKKQKTLPKQLQQKIMASKKKKMK